MTGQQQGISPSITAHANPARRTVILTRMAADIPEITDSNQEHMLSDLHECLRILGRIDRLLTKYEPILEQFGASPISIYSASKRARRQANGRD